MNFFELYADDDDDKPSEHGDYKIISTVNCKSELGLVPALQSIHLIHTEHGHDTERPSPVSVILEDDDSRVFYSGDTSTLDTLHTAEQLYGTMSEVYFEACSMDIESHVSIERLAKEFTPEDRKKITLMHINNDDLVQIATELGFKIATTSRILVSVPRST
ncbi:hypothetical protein FACS1894189_5740 [Planctomycetales bacterium]|nr:hypothetical protein FACS1894189_5740 [Planctomycetales bacterium]